MASAPNNTAAIKAAVREVANAHGSAYIDANANVDAYTHQCLQSLAAVCGVSDPFGATDRDLISLYSVARKNETSARQVAERINAKNSAATLTGTASGLPPIVEPGTPLPPASDPHGDPTPRFVPEPPPSTPAGPGLDLWDVRNIVVQEVQKIVPPIQNAIDGFAQSVASDLADVRSRIPTDSNIRDRVHVAVSDALKALAPTVLEIHHPAKEPIQLGTVHFKTPDIIKAMAAGVNVYLHGPAGSGKTTAARKAADALGVAFYFAAKIESEYLLLGFTGANGTAVRTQFREAYENGGLFLFDEMDASSPAAIVALNAALANGVCPFPDGIVARHPDFYCIGAGNTVLTGSNRQYNGRVQLDAASVDRFAFIEFPYDEVLEMELASNRGWCLHVQALRKAVADRGLMHLITPRATLDGCKLLDAGFTWEAAESMSVFKGLDADTASQIRNAASLVSGVL